MANKFKVGDVVECVDASQSTDILRCGSHYRVVWSGEYYIQVDLPHNASAEWRHDRFILVSKGPEWSPEETPKVNHPSVVTEIIDKITYKPGWKILHGQDNGRSYLQVSVDCFAEASMDSVKRDGSRTPWKSGKRYLSPHMCRQEIVGVCFDLIKAAEMHEVHEWFRYKGASIFNPHLDPDVLVDVAKKASSFNVRKNAMSMEEDGGTS